MTARGFDLWGVPYDGAANPLYLLRGLHSAFIKRGGQYFLQRKVTSLKAAPHNFTVTAGVLPKSAPPFHCDEFGAGGLINSLYVPAGSPKE